MKTNWIFEKPIDFEHKQYVLLDFIQKTKSDLDDYKLYPAFQQLTLHLANLNLVLSSGDYIDTSEPLDYDDEILISDIVHHKVKGITIEDYKVMQEVGEYSKEQIINLFMFAKSIWSLVNDSVSLKVVKNSDLIGTGNGYFKFNFEDELFVYEYKLKYSTPGDLSSQKCHIRKIYQGVNKGLHNILLDNTVFFHPDVDKKDLVKILPIFELKFDTRYPLEETIIPMARRKVLSYILQSIKIHNIKTLPDGE
jgi:hypothetical protein